MPQNSVDLAYAGYDLWRAAGQPWGAFYQEARARERIEVSRGNIGQSSNPAYYFEVGVVPMGYPEWSFYQAILYIPTTELHDWLTLLAVDFSLTQIAIGPGLPAPDMGTIEARVIPYTGVAPQMVAGKDITSYPLLGTYKWTPLGESTLRACEFVMAPQALDSISPTETTQVLLCTPSMYNWTGAMPPGGRGNDLPPINFRDHERWYLEGFAQAAESPTLTIGHDNNYAAQFAVRIGLRTAHVWGDHNAFSAPFGMGVDFSYRLRRVAPLKPDVPIEVFDGAGVFVGPLRAASLSWTEELGAPWSLDELTVAPKQVTIDGATESRLWLINEGWEIAFLGQRYRILRKEGDAFSGLKLSGLSIERWELENQLSNELPFPAEYVSMTPTEIGRAVLNGETESFWPNGDFRDLVPLSSYFLPGKPRRAVYKEWTQEAGDWTFDLGTHWVGTASATGRLVSEPCTVIPGSQLRMALDVRVPVGYDANFFLSLQWYDASGLTLVATDAIPLEVDPGQTVVDFLTSWQEAAGNVLRVQFEVDGNNEGLRACVNRIRIQHRVPAAGWQFVSDLDARPSYYSGDTLIADQFGVWNNDSSGVWSITPRSTLMQAFTGDFVTIYFGNGTGSADVVVDGVAHPTLTLTGARTYTASGLDPHRDHLLEIRVASGTVRVVALEISSENRLTLRANYRNAYEVLQDLAQLTGGELLFDGYNRFAHLRARVGEDLTTTEFRRGKNLVSYEKSTETGTDDVGNVLFLLGYGDPPTQLVLKHVEADELGLGTVRRVITAPEVRSPDVARRRLAAEAAVRKWGRQPRLAEITWTDASLLRPGDVCRFYWDDDEGEEQRIVSIKRETGRATVQLTLGARPTSEDSVLRILRLARKLEDLLRG